MTNKNLRKLGYLILLLSLPLGLIVRGFILSVLWRWFALPLGLPEISVSLAIGVALIVSFLTFKDTSEFSSRMKSVDDEEFTNAITMALMSMFFMPFWLLLTAWLVHQFQ